MDISFYVEPSTLLCFIHFKSCSDVLLCDCFEKEDGRKVCYCLIHYSRSVWCCLAEYFFIIQDLSGVVWLSIFTYMMYL